jgi:Dyp-type peroxidase family
MPKSPHQSNGYPDQPAPPSPPPNDFLNNTEPVPDLQLDHPGNEPYKNMFRNLQGNILKGHGRDFSANIFVRFSGTPAEIKSWLQGKASLITSAATQLKESKQFKQYGIPGALFCNIFLTAGLYRRLGFTTLDEDFKDPFVAGVDVLPQHANFLNGMLAGAPDFHDDVDDLQQRRASGETDPLEDAYLDSSIDALILFADDSESFLHRSTRNFIDEFENGSGIILSVELGKALRNDEGEGIEHFGYVDGRSQPLYLASDFKHLRSDGSIDLKLTKEKINEKAVKRESGDIHIWNPFAPLRLVLKHDTLAGDPSAFGSYFVFRKLEQDVMRFTIEEQRLADELRLNGQDRERAGAMAVGRFRDGTPLVLSEADGLIPAKANNFRYDGLAADLSSDSQPSDGQGWKCPFHAHIRKTNPRHSTPPFTGSDSIRAQETADLDHRITRRGIPFGERNRKPNEFQALDDLPQSGVGLLFACFQSSIVKQFAFMQKTWVNNTGFKRPETGIDPLIGQRDAANPPAAQHWRKAYGEDISGQEPNEDFPASHPVSYPFDGFIRFRGGEFFFAPSILFFERLVG